jgi:hypothetical protein
MAARGTPFLEAVLRRELTAIGRTVEPSPAASLIAAANPATFVAVFVIDFRRVTRWFALREVPSTTEWELVRACVCRGTRPDAEAVESDGR